MKKVLNLALLAALISGGLLTSCDSKIKVGILQPVEHDALGLAREGFISGLAEKGYVNKDNIKIIYQNANGDASNLTTLAKSLVGKCDITLGIGTDASKSLQAAALNSGSTKPILFTAVTDAVSAGLVESNANPGGFITGTSDANPVEAQIALIKDCIPDVDKIGVLYTQSEVNSQVQANQASAEATKQGLECVIKTCTDSSDIKSVATNLCNTAGLDAIYIPTDNNIAANMSAVKAAAFSKGILVVCGEEGQLKDGGHVTLSVSYSELGKRTGLIAASILSGEKTPSEIAVTTMSQDECSFVKHSANLQSAGISLPSTIASKFVEYAG